MKFKSDFEFSFIGRSLLIDVAFEGMMHLCSQSLLNVTALTMFTFVGMSF